MIGATARRRLDCLQAKRKRHASMNEQDQIQERLAHLSAEHRDLDDAIQALSQRAVPDMIQIQRLKKRKLHLRDEITLLESHLVPDIIA